MPTNYALFKFVRPETVTKEYQVEFICEKSDNNTHKLQVIFNTRLEIKILGLFPTPFFWCAVS